MMGFSLKCQQTLNWYGTLSMLDLHTYVCIHYFATTKYTIPLYIDENMCVLYLFGCSQLMAWFLNTILVLAFYIFVYILAFEFSMRNTARTYTLQHVDETRERERTASCLYLCTCIQHTAVQYIRICIFVHANFHNTNKTSSSHGDSDGNKLYWSSHSLLI